MHLIRAKQSIPRLTPDLVPRPRLVQQLNAGLARKLLLVSAPAGFGKTTLLSEWAHQAPYPVAWVTFDQNDDNLHSFLSYFVTAVEMHYPGSCAETQSVLTAATLPPVNVLIPVLANELVMLPGELILVLDDYQTLQQMEIHNLLDRLVSYLPPNFHLVLGTRSSPPLSLLTLRAQGQLSELRQPTLRFTQQETRHFFAKVGQVALDEELLESLDVRTEGWPAGLRLLLLSVEGNDELRSIAARFSLGDADIMSYLTDQVLAKQPPALVHFLLCTAIVERFSLSIYPILAPERSAEEVDEVLLAQCLRDNLFVVSLGEGWYRYHPLFRELLLHQYERQIGPQGLADLHRLASGWLEENGLVGDAIRHALLAKDEALAMAVLYRHRTEAMNQEQWAQLEHWLKLFPRSLVERHPILGITEVWILHTRSMVVDQAIVLERLEKQLANDEPTLDPAIRQIVLGEYYSKMTEKTYASGDFVTTITYGQRSLELLPFQHSHVRAVAHIGLFIGYLYSGALAQAQVAIDRAAEEEAFQNAIYVGRIAILRFSLLFFQLKLSEAARVAAQLRIRSQQGAYMESLCWALYFLGRVAYVENLLEDARRYFEELMLHRHAARFMPATDGLASLSMVYQALGMPEEALRMAEDLMNSVSELGAKNLVEDTIAFKSHLALLQDRPVDAVAWVQKKGPAKFVGPGPWYQVVPFTIVRVLLAAGSTKSLDEVALMLAEMQETARITGSVLHLTQIFLFQALLHDRLGESEAAQVALEDALNLAQSSRAIRLFADLGNESQSRLSSLLQKVDRKSPVQSFVRQLLDALPMPVVAGSLKQTASTARELVEQLSPREINILQLIEEGLSNKEIGRRLFISDKTVENHTTNIYQKLQVHNRTQAVRRGKRTWSLDIFVVASLTDLR